MNAFRQQAEWQREIGPERIAREICKLRRCPGDRLGREGRSRIVQTFENGTCWRFDCRPEWLIGTDVARSQEGNERHPLKPSIDRDACRCLGEVFSPSQSKCETSGGECCGNLPDEISMPQADMDIDGCSDDIEHNIVSVFLAAQLRSEEAHVFGVVADFRLRFFREWQLRRVLSVIARGFRASEPRSFGRPAPR